jgi:hypothetical protein
MRVSALDGRTIEVRRRWMPWRLRAREFDNDDVDPFWAIDGSDPGEIIFGLILGLVFLLFGGIILTVFVFAGEFLLLLLLLFPAFVVARMFWVLPWIIEAREGTSTLGLVKVRGWRDSEEKIRDLAASYRRGEDPFDVRDAA